MSSTRSGEPSFVAVGATSSRTQCASSSAIGQRKIPAGVTATLLWSGRITASRCTASTAPHSPGPTRVGSGWNTAILASRTWQAEGAAGAAAAAGSSGNAA